MNQDVERFGDAGNRHVVAFDNGFVCLGTAHDIVRLDGEDFLQDMRCTECLKSPNFHFTETLTTEVRFTTKGLLGDKGVWSNATCMHLVVNHVVQFEHVDITDSCRLVETVARLAVVQVGAAIFGQSSFAHISIDLFEGGTVGVC